MKRILKLLATALVGVAAAATESTASERATEIHRLPPPRCCELATLPVATGTAGWTLKLPSGVTMTPVPVVPVNPHWAAAFPNSKWVANSVNAGHPWASNDALPGQPPGVYTYEYHFCLCPLPSGAKTVPASLSLHAWADDDVAISLNNSPVLAQKLNGYGFLSSPPLPPNLGTPVGGTALVVKETWFAICENVLTFRVNNSNLSNGTMTPTGLDVVGTISGYFGSVRPGASCPCPSKGK